MVDYNLTIHLKLCHKTISIIPWLTIKIAYLSSVGKLNWGMQLKCSKPSLGKTSPKKLQWDFMIRFTQTIESFSSNYHSSIVIWSVIAILCILQWPIGLISFGQSSKICIRAIVTMLQITVWYNKRKWLSKWEKTLNWHKKEKRHVGHLKLLEEWRPNHNGWRTISWPK